MTARVVYNSDRSKQQYPLFLPYIVVLLMVHKRTFIDERITAPVFDETLAFMCDELN